MWQSRSCQTHITEQSQHLVVGSVVGNEESEVGVSKDGCYPDEASSATWNDTDILPGVLALLSLTMVFVVEVSNGLSEGLDTSGRAL